MGGAGGVMVSGSRAADPVTETQFQPSALGQLFDLWHQVMPGDAPDQEPEHHEMQQRLVSGGLQPSASAPLVAPRARRLIHRKRRNPFQRSHASKSSRCPD